MKHKMGRRITVEEAANKLGVDPQRLWGLVGDYPIRTSRIPIHWNPREPWESLLPGKDARIQIDENDLPRIQKLLSMRKVTSKKGE